MAVKNKVSEVAGPLNANPNSFSNYLTLIMSIVTPAYLKTRKILLEVSISRRFVFNFNAALLINYLCEKICYAALTRVNLSVSGN